MARLQEPAVHPVAAEACEGQVVAVDEGQLEVVGRKLRIQVVLSGLTERGRPERVEVFRQADIGLLGVELVQREVEQRHRAHPYLFGWWTPLAGPPPAVEGQWSGGPGRGWR